MINIKNIFKVLLIALFVCAYSGGAEAVRDDDLWGDARSGRMKNQEYLAHKTVEINSKKPGGCLSQSDCSDGQKCDKGKCVADNKGGVTNVEVNGPGGSNDPDFCSSDLGIFEDLIKAGKKIFKQLRDLIYVVAGFGIIAVAVGGFFGNLNWKWLGAIVISLVVIATAGELVVLLTGCESFSGSLITNTLKEPAPKVGTEENLNPYTKEYNEKYTEKAEARDSEWIDWNDSMDVLDKGKQ